MTISLASGTIGGDWMPLDLPGVPPELIAFMSRVATPPPAAANPLTVALRQIADRIPRLRAQAGRISEEDTKRILITPAVEALGWDIHDFDEVRNEYRHNTADNPVDYALFLNRSPVLFVEAKPLGHSLDDRKWLVQTINYANAVGVDWCALTNGAEWRVYKVHAQVEADRKLFTAVTLDKVDALDDAVSVLSLLSRENMRVRAIDDLWQAWHVDSQVQAALEQTLQGDAFAALIRKRLPQLTLSDVRKSLRRASITVNYPNIFRDAPISSIAVPTPATLPNIVAGQVSEKAGAGAPALTKIANSGDPAAGRRRLQSTQELFELGRLKVGETLIIRGPEDSATVVLDGRHVEFQGKNMTFNEWGQHVTRWPSIRIYTMACLPDGRTLDQLRDQPDTSSGAT